MNAPIKVIKNFIQEPEIGTMIDYVDYLEKTELDKFAQYQSGKRLALRFGVDEDPDHTDGSFSNLGILGDNKSFIASYLDKTVATVKKAFEVDESLYVCSFWFAKQYPGATVGEHADTGDGGGDYNMHFKYSAVLYLNTMTEGGQLVFRDENYTYSPRAGDLVVFPSPGIIHGVHEILETRYSLPMWITNLESMALS
jgi:hypothetical protein